MLKLYSLTIIFFLSALRLTAQFDTDYKPVTSTGTLPPDFVTLSSKKYEEAKSKLSSKENKSSRKIKESFLLSTNFAIDDILLSGKVLFNDELTNYLNGVADNALVSEPGLRKELRFYVYKSTAVNAFSTNQGIVLVTTGLLAQLENEAELAFILCHEAIHYREKHAIQEYVEEDKIQKGRGAYGQLALEERIVARCAFSKEEEKEADQKGLEIFLKSKYSTKHLIGVYDVLKYAYLPFDDIKFDKNFLENSTMKFPNDFYKTNTQQIDTKDIMDDDPRSTHPSVASRREKTLGGIKDADNTGKSDFLVGEKQFDNIREISRFEICRLYTLHNHYESGIYTSYLLLKKYPNNLYLKKNVAFCLAGLAQYSNSDKFREIHYDSDSVEGKWQALFYLTYKLDSMKNGALNVVALAYATKLKNDYPNDNEIEELYKNLMHSLVKVNRLHYDDFSTKPYVKHIPAKEDSLEAVAAAAKPDTADYDAPKSKYEKLRAQHVVDVKHAENDSIFTRYAFVDYMGKQWFKEDFANMEDSTKQITSSSRLIVTFSDDNDSYQRKKITYWKNRIYTLGINKIVIVDPEFAMVNSRNKEKYKYIESEEGRVDFTERLKLNAKRAKLGAEVLNTKNLDAGEAEKLNDVAVMSDYISERLSHENDVEVPYIERARVKDLAKKYGTGYFMWTGAVALKNGNRQYTMLYTIIYDVNTDEIKMSTFREIKNRASASLLNSQLYDMLNQVKTPTHKKS
jgi:hypothetical protein